jgi:hypothetical protein
MKPLLALGLILIVLGVLSLVVPVRQTEHHGVNAGGVSLGVDTHHSETVAPIISAVLILGGVGLAVAGKFQTA